MLFLFVLPFHDSSELPPIHPITSNLSQHTNHPHKKGFLADLVTFTEEILDGKFHFLCSDHLSNKKILIPLMLSVKLPISC